MQSFNNIFILVLTFLCVNTILQAQCSDIYFYRVNNPLLQSAKSVYLFQNGEEVARLNLGHRIKATVCSPGQYEFVVKANPNSMAVIKKVIQVEDGQSYYLKLACLAVGEVATIDQVPASKGAKEIQKGNKFNGAIRDINLSANSIVNNSSGGEVVEPKVTPSDGTFQKVQTSNKFKFEIVNITKAGGLLELDYKITNLSQDDRLLELCPAMTHFYDDLSNLIFPYETCLANDCEKASYYSGIGQVRTKYYCNGSSSAMMPSGIPLKARITIKDINDRATKFLRGTIWFKSENEFRIGYEAITFPTLIDKENPNKRNFGNQSIELIEAKRDGNATVVEFKHSNGDAAVYNFKITGGTIYDDQGNQFKIDGLAFANASARANSNRAYRDWQREINTGSTVNIYTFTDQIPNSSSELRRIDIKFEGFDLTWNNIKMKGVGTSSNATNSSSQAPIINTSPVPNTKYIKYTSFKEKVRNNESVIGKKIILEKIYFNSGSDDLLDGSVTQLDELAQLIQSNSRLKMEFSGHTDNVGDKTSNMLLSQQRADAIRYYLIKKGVNPARIISIGKGESEPISNNLTESDRQQNRRVEITIVD